MSLNELYELFVVANGKEPTFLVMSSIMLPLSGLSAVNMCPYPILLIDGLSENTAFFVGGHNEWMEQMPSDNISIILK